MSPNVKKTLENRGLGIFHSTIPTEKLTREKLNQLLQVRPLSARLSRSAAGAPSRNHPFRPKSAQYLPHPPRTRRKSCPENPRRTRTIKRKKRVVQKKHTGRVSSRGVDPHVVDPRGVDPRGVDPRGVVADNNDNRNRGVSSKRPRSAIPGTRRQPKNASTVSEFVTSVEYLQMSLKDHEPREQVKSVRARPKSAGSLLSMRDGIQRDLRKCQTARSSNDGLNKSNDELKKSELSGFSLSPSAFCRKMSKGNVVGDPAKMELPNDPAFQKYYHLYVEPKLKRISMQKELPTKMKLFKANLQSLVNRWLHLDCSEKQKNEFLKFFHRLEREILSQRLDSKKILLSHIMDNDFEICRLYGTHFFPERIQDLLLIWFKTKATKPLINQFKSIMSKFHHYYRNKRFETAYDQDFLSIPKYKKDLRMNMSPTRVATIDFHRNHPPSKPLRSKQDKKAVTFKFPDRTAYRDSFPPKYTKVKYQKAPKQKRMKTGPIIYLTTNQESYPKHPLVINGKPQPITNITASIGCRIQPQPSDYHNPGYEKQLDGVFSREYMNADPRPSVPPKTTYHQLYGISSKLKNNPMLAKYIQERQTNRRTPFDLTGTDVNQHYISESRKYGDHF